MVCNPAVWTVTPFVLVTETSDVPELTRVAMVEFVFEMPCVDTRTSGSMRLVRVPMDAVVTSTVNSQVLAAFMVPALKPTLVAPADAASVPVQDPDVAVNEAFGTGAITMPEGKASLNETPVKLSAVDALLAKKIVRLEISSGWMFVGEKLLLTVTELMT